MKWRKIQYGTGSPWFLPKFTAKAGGWNLSVTAWAKGYGGKLGGYYFFASKKATAEVFNSAWENSGLPNYHTYQEAMVAIEKWVAER